MKTGFRGLIKEISVLVSQKLQRSINRDLTRRIGDQTKGYQNISQNKKGKNKNTKIVV